MKRICMDCKKYIGEAIGPADLETHGLCEPCFEDRMKEIRAERSRQLKGASCAAAEQFANTFNFSGRSIQSAARCTVQAICVIALAIAAACTAFDGWLQRPHWPDSRRDELADMVFYPGGDGSK